MQGPSGTYGPQGPYYPPPVPQKKKSHKVVWSVLAVGLVVVIAFCAIVVSAMNGVSKVVSGSPTTSSGSSSSSGNTIAKVGQTITVDNVNCTVTSASVISGDDVSVPKKGDEFVVVHVKMVNTGQSDQSYNVFDFHTKSSSGNVVDMNLFTPSSYIANSLLDSGTLAAGGKVEGDMIGEIPIGDLKAELTWSPSFFGSSSQYAWTLNAK